MATFYLQVIGTPIESIKASEDRQTFADKLKEIGEKIAPSVAVETVSQCFSLRDMHFPLILESYCIHLACKRRRISICHFSRRRETTAGNTSVFAGYLLQDKFIFGTWVSCYRKNQRLKRQRA